MSHSFNVYDSQPLAQTLAQTFSFITHRAKVLYFESNTIFLSEALQGSHVHPAGTGRQRKREQSEGKEEIKASLK